MIALQGRSDRHREPASERRIKHVSAGAGEPPDSTGGGGVRRRHPSSMRGLLKPRILRANFQFLPAGAKPASLVSIDASSVSPSSGNRFCGLSCVDLQAPLAKVGQFDSLISVHLSSRNSPQTPVADNLSPYSAGPQRLGLIAQPIAEKHDLLMRDDILREGHVKGGLEAPSDVERPY